MRLRPLPLAAAALLMLGGAALANGEAGYARLEGHGGPIRGIAVSPDGTIALTASFDNSVGVWDLTREGAEPVWLEGHEAAVNAVAVSPDGMVALSTGDDFDAILWSLADGEPLRRLEGHEGKVIGAAFSADGALVATAGWDGAVGLWDAASGERLAMLTGHRSQVQDVAFAEGDAVLFSASADGTIRRWDVVRRAYLREEASHGFGVNRLVLDEAAGWLAYGALDGGVRVLDLETGEEVADVTSGRRPVLGLALSRDRSRLGIADGEGHVHIVETDGWQTVRDFRATPRGPVWALAFDASGRRVVTGTLQDYAEIWPVASAGVAEDDGALRGFQRDPAEMTNGERQFVRKCSICHALGEDGERRAGPTLHRVFGRRAGTLPGYEYSDALKGADLTWSPETLDKLFDIGPDHYTPGSKMPMQRIVRGEDRADLIEWLRTATETDQ